VPETWIGKPPATKGDAECEITPAFEYLLFAIEFCTAAQVPDAVMEAMFFRFWLRTLVLNDRRHLNCVPCAEVISHVLQMRSELRVVFAAQFVVGIQGVQQFADLDSLLLRPHKGCFTNLVSANLFKPMFKEPLCSLLVSRSCALSILLAA